jgi:hypothetical protein
VNYTSLKTSIADWIARSDLTSGTLDDLIDFAEARINRELRVRAMESIYFRELDSDASAAVPTTYRQWKNAYLYKGTPDTTDTFNAFANTLVSPLQTTQMAGAAQDFQFSRGNGLWLTRIGPRFYVSGKPSGTYSLGGIYYAGFTALSGAAPTNWLTDTAPDLLLSACMFEAATYIKNQTEMQFWAARTTALLGQVQAESDREQWSGEQMVTRP